jgi:hypothetical protein
MTAPLSPAAQAVLNVAYDYTPLEHDARLGAAAILRAAADQVVVEDQGEGPDCCLTVSEQIRADFLAIAAELETK